jgi:hypothetical protein
MDAATMTTASLKEDTTPTTTSAGFAELQAKLEQLAGLDDTDAFFSFFEELGVKMEQFRDDMTGLFNKYRHFQTAIEQGAYASPGDLDLLALALLIRDFDFDDVKEVCEKNDAPFVINNWLAAHLGRLASHPVD